jgi:hypothetical protein
VYALDQHAEEFQYADTEADVKKVNELIQEMADALLESGRF